jgi:hypothetical protein
MASIKRPPSDPPGGRRPPPTVINLEATEVSLSSSESASKADDRIKPDDHTNPDKPAPPQQAADPPPSPETAVEAKPSEPQPSEPQPEELRQPAAEAAPAAPPPPSNPQRPWSLPIIAGLSSLGGGAVLFVLLWLSGALSIGPLTSSLSEATTTDLSPRLGAIEQQLKELSARSATTAADPRVLNDVAVRLGKLESAISVPRAPDPVVQSRLAAAESAAKAASDNVANLSRRLDTLEAALRESGGQIQQLAAATAELQTRLRDTGAGADRPVRLAVAASALRAAVERGEPYATELAIVKPLASDTAAVSVLEPFAASGLPSQAALGEALAAIIRPLLTAPAEPARDSTFLDKLQANAGKLIHSRPIGEAVGDDRGAILARIEQRATQANLSGAQAELAKLPADARAPIRDQLQAWIAKADARNKALDASRRVAAEAVAALKASP